MNIIYDTRIFVAFGILIIILTSGCLSISQSAPTGDFISKYVDTNRLIPLAKENGISIEMIKDIIERAKNGSKEYVKLSIFYLDALSDNQKVPDNAKVIALNISTEIQKIGLIKPTVLENYEEFSGNVYQINHFIETINEKSGTALPSIQNPREFFDKIKNLKLLVDYVPLIDPYNDVYLSSLNITPHAEDKYYKIFYRDVAILGAEIAVIEADMGYKIAFKSTGEIVSELKLYKLREFVGNKGYGLTLSAIHWKFREKFNESWDKLIELLKKEGLIR